MAFLIFFKALYSFSLHAKGNLVNMQMNQPSGPMVRRIFLLGFMGTGKSHWGKEWAERFDMSFIDLDELIEKEEQKTVLDIFEKEGEEYFRKKEAATLREKCLLNNCIISCGGGTPCFYDNMRWMNENGHTIYLSASPTYLLKNVMEEKERRPLVKNINEAELLFFIEQKLKERNPFYNQARFTLNAESLEQDSLQQILALND